MLYPHHLLSSCCLLSLVGLFGCGGGGGTNAPTTVIGLPNSFNDVTTAARLNLPHAKATATPHGAGATSGDYDNDGFVDLLILRDRDLPGLLLRNRGDGTFEDATAGAKLSITGNTCGPCFADIDGDGFLDILVLGVLDARPQLFRNLGNGTFKDITAQSKITATGDTTSAAFGDYDGDGDLDLFITRWEKDNTTRKTDGFLWRNNGDLTFTDVSVASKISNTIRVSKEGDLSFTPNFADINNDGWPDLLIAADFKTSRIFINKKDGTFEDTTTSVIDDDAGMGAAVADYDNDGDLDWFVSSIYHPNPANGWTGNRLYRNKGNGTFENVTSAAGVLQGDWGWASSFCDFDLDGHLDLVHVNGWLQQGFELNATRLFMSNRDGTFTESAVRLGIDDKSQGRGLVCFDFDNDGDIDILTENLVQAWRLFRNDLDHGNYLKVKLRGKAPNTEAIGARVIIRIGGESQMREIQCGSNYLGQNPANAHFGVGTATRIDELRIVWPDGAQTVETQVDVNKSMVITR